MGQFRMKGGYITGAVIADIYTREVAKFWTSYVLLGSPKNGSAISY